ncbi:hypothetical protein IAI58_19305 (plasmid) [Roseomonas marmotae]|uniref:hypothetical protein n=1 Tax=Roseomonas marmotae TaxID=2768161 RepID=UPI001AD77D0D|nr:hypothetical protein [Roseomonas marmotae]QTI81491.1 hypothetical protein IAI58_19305 [Roseomonas marmotae]
MSDPVLLRVLHPFVVAGEIAAEGEIVEVTFSEAKDLLYRGKAELVDAAEPGFLADEDPIEPVAEATGERPFEVVEPGEKTGETTIDGQPADVIEPQPASPRGKRGRRPSRR